MTCGCSWSFWWRGEQIALHRVTLRMFQEWVDGLRGSNSTVGRRVNSIKSLFSFATKIGYMAYNVSLAEPLSMSTQRNDNVPAKHVGANTIIGPQYKIGPSATRHIFRHTKKQFPNLRRIENSQRVSGARAHVPTDPGKEHYDDNFRYPVFKLKKEDPEKADTRQGRLDF